MASIHINEIQSMLAKQGKKDALPHQVCSEGYFLEIRFDEPGKRLGSVDGEYKNKVLSVDCPYGSVLILFDEEGLLKSIEIS